MRTLSATSALRLGSLAFCTALVAGCASAPPKAERYVAPPIGASWKVQVSSTGSFGNASKVEQQVSMRDVVVEGSRTTASTWAAARRCRTIRGLVHVLGPGDRPLMRMTRRWATNSRSRWARPRHRI